jgi:molecular chaperone Hsp33
MPAVHRTFELRRFLCFASVMSALESDLTSSAPSPLEVRTYFVRGRNTLVARADFEPLYIDYYLHRADHDLKYTNEQDTMVKDALAALTLHLASRPQDESCGWTMNFHDPHVNLFVTGGSRPARVAGRIFTEDVRDLGKNVFIAQTTRLGQPPRQSMVDIGTTDIFRCVEEYYSQSEQRLTRLFRHSGEDYVMVSAQPDADEAWLSSLTDDDIRVLDQHEPLALLETRTYIWECGCSVERLYPILAKLNREGLRDAFGDDEVITLQCPRCGARYRAAKEQFEAWQEHG